MAHDGLHGETDLHTTQLLCALRAQLSACPELADCSDLGAFIVKKYAPAAERAGDSSCPPRTSASPSSLASSRWRRAPSTPSLPPTLRRRARAATSGTITAPTYDSNDNTTSAQMHRFFDKMASAGIDLGDNVLADPWA